jgi:hypothetical protein
MRFDIHRLQQLDERAKSGQMTSEDRQLLVALIRSHSALLNLLKDPATTRDDLAPYLSDDDNDTALDAATSDRSDSPREGRSE